MGSDVSRWKAFRVHGGSQTYPAVELLASIASAPGEPDELLGYRLHIVGVRSMQFPGLYPPGDDGWDFGVARRLYWSNTRPQGVTCCFGPARISIRGRVVCLPVVGDPGVVAVAAL